MLRALHKLVSPRSRLCRGGAGLGAGFNRGFINAPSIGDTQRPPTATSPELATAATTGDADRVRELLRQGASVDMPQADGMTPLIASAMNGHATVVDVLLAANATVGLADADGDTALVLAAQEGHVHIVRALLDAGASPAEVLAARECADDEGWIDVVALLEAHTAQRADLGEPTEEVGQIQRLSLRATAADRFRSDDA